MKTVTCCLVALLLGCGAKDDAKDDDSKKDEGKQSERKSLREDLAKAQIKKIETAAVQYKMKHGAFPASLQELAEPLEGDDAYLDKKDLIDPWGSPFAFDPFALNKFGKPHIYSEGDPGKKKPISNLQEPTK